MQEKAKVISIDKDIVKVVALDIDVCIGCSNSECKGNGSIFTAINNRHFDIKVGSEVRVGASAKKQLLQAIWAIGIPVLLAIGVWHIIPLVFSGANEGLRVGGVLFALAFGVLLVSLANKHNIKDYPDIIEII